MVLKINIYTLSVFLLYYSLIHSSYSPPMAITAGKSIFRTIEKKVYLETANNRRPTMSQGTIALIADRMIYDEELEIGYAYGDLRFVDIDNKTFLSAQEGTFISKEKKAILRKAPEILIEQKENKSIRILGKVITVYPDDSYIHVQGNIEIDNGDTFITGKEVRIWTKKDQMIVSGEVQSVSESQKLATDKLSIQFSNGDLQYYTASGRVIAVNTEDKMTIMSGFLSYNHTTKTFKATDKPSIYFQERSTISYANIIEYNQNTDEGSLLGDVISVQNNGEQIAYSRWALYDGVKRTINMFGNPRLKQQESEVFGTEIIVNVDKNNMKIVSGGRGFFKK